MSVVIVGGNERMVRQYKELCQSYNCNARVYTNLYEQVELETVESMACFTCRKA